MKRRVRTRKPVQPNKLSYALVAIQLGLLLGVLYAPGVRTGGPQVLLGNLMRLGGLGAAIVALWQLRAYSLSALPEPVKRAKLLTTGLYGRVRHPVYSGLMLWAIGTLIIRPSTSRLAFCLALVVLFWFKSRREERMLNQTFGSAYSRYAAITPRFIPRRG